MNLKFEISRYMDNDIIATSGTKGCPTFTNMTEKSYYFTGHMCSWELTGSDNDLKGKQGISDTGEGYVFTYYDENGKEQSVNQETVSSIVGLYFHYDGNGKFEICTNSNHHYQ